MSMSLSTAPSFLPSTQVMACHQTTPFPLRLCIGIISVFFFLNILKEYYNFLLWSGLQTMFFRRNGHIHLRIIYMHSPISPKNIVFDRKTTKLTYSLSSLWDDIIFILSFSPFIFTPPHLCLPNTPKMYLLHIIRLVLLAYVCNEWVFFLKPF